MTIEELVKKLEDVEKEHGGDWEVVHSKHDDLLLEYINDPKITEIFNRTEKWCA